MVFNVYKSKTNFSENDPGGRKNGDPRGSPMAWPTPVKKSWVRTPLFQSEISTEVKI